MKLLPVARFTARPGDGEEDEAWGIETGADLKAKSMAFLQAHFGSAAGWYYAIGGVRQPAERS